MLKKCVHLKVSPIQYVKYIRSMELIRLVVEWLKMAGHSKKEHVNA